MVHVREYCHKGLGRRLIREVIHSWSSWGKSKKCNQDGAYPFPFLLTSQNNENASHWLETEVSARDLVAHGEATLMVTALSSVLLHLLQGTISQSRDSRRDWHWFWQWPAGGDLKDILKVHEELNGTVGGNRTENCWRKWSVETQPTFRTYGKSWPKDWGSALGNG